MAHHDQTASSSQTDRERTDETVGDRHVVTTERMATGGEAVARLEDGCVVFVRGAWAGETVAIELTERRKRFARGRVIEVQTASKARVPLSCSHAQADCGGCDWLFAAPGEQRHAKVEIVIEQLSRLGGIAEPTVRHHDARGASRTTVRCTVTDQRAGFRARRSSLGFAAKSCQAVHPTLEEMMIDGRFPGVDEVTLRVAPSTGDRLVLVHDVEPDRATSVMAGLTLPDDVTVTADPGQAGITHIVKGREFYVSAGSFFQSSDVGTEALADAVAEALEGSSGPVVDLYGGVGMLGGVTVPDRLARVVESSPTACADARTNLGAEVDVIEARVEHWSPDATHPTVIADPARSGLGARGLATIESCEASRLALVSCDPAALGRDIGLLRERGWRVVHSTVIDMFPDTSRIEVVTRLDR